jgi:magnesium transporter
MHMDEELATLLDSLETLIEGGELDAARSLLAEEHPADIAALLDELSPEQAFIAFSLLPNESASEVLDETGTFVRNDLVEKVDDERLADLLEELPADDAVEFLEDLPDTVADRLMGLMEPEAADDIRQLLAYEEETAGRLMARDVVALRRQWTVAETLNYLRSLEDAETLQYLYVVDRDDMLLGVVPLRLLVLSQPDTTIESIMGTEVVSVPVDIDQEELADMVSRYDYNAMPVVDRDGRLLGVVTVDDILDVLEEEATEDIQRLGGSEPLDQPYFSASLFQVFRKRVGWLLLLFVGATLTGSVTRLYEEQIALAIALTYFTPMIIGTGGNAGSQTVATIIRAITLGEVRLSTMWQALGREIGVAILLGLVMGVLGLVRALFWDTGFEIALVVALTLPVVVIWACITATVVPILADQFNIDPAVISGPMITTIVDATGLLIYFRLAIYILDL